MSALHDSYLRGAHKLCKETKRGSLEHDAAIALHIRLKEILNFEIHGHNNNQVTDLIEILGKLSKITEDLFGIIFVEYCNNLDMQLQSSQNKDESTERENSSPLQNIADTPAPNSIREENTELHAQESDQTKQDHEFLIRANAYIATLLSCIQNARKASNHDTLSSQEFKSIHTSLRPFDCSPKLHHDPILFKVRVQLVSANDRIQEVAKLFQQFFLDAQETNRGKSKTQSDLDSKLKVLQSEIESIQRFVASILQERAIPNKNTLLDDIS